jgi:hypothetical protein
MDVLLILDCMGEDVISGLCCKLFYLMSLRIVTIQKSIFGGLSENYGGRLGAVIGSVLVSNVILQ